MAVLKFKDNLGAWHSIPAIQGPSAYEQAVEGGYEGTLEDFYLALNEVNAAVQAAEDAEDSASAAAASALQLAAGVASPAGTYANLAAVNAVNPAHDRTYLTENDWKIALWDETAEAFVAGGVYQATAIADGSVLPIKTTFFSHGKNLFDISTVSVGYYIDNVGLTESSGHNTSDYIEVGVGLSYSISPSCFRIAYFNSAKEYLSKEDYPTNPITINAGVAYIRYTFFSYTTALQQMEQAASPTAFEKYYGFVVSNAHIGSIPVAKLDGAVPAKNKFNKATAYLGYLNPDTGAVVTSITYMVSDFIDVDSGDVYSLTNVRSVGYYDADKVWQSGEDSPASITPAHPYIRVSVAVANLSTAQIEKSASPTTYEPYKMVIANSMLEESGAEAYDQPLNTTDSVEFVAVTTTGTLPSGTLASPPAGLASGDVWSDTTDSATHPILRVKA